MTADHLVCRDLPWPCPAQANVEEHIGGPDGDCESALRKFQEMSAYVLLPQSAAPGGTAGWRPCRKGLKTRAAL